ncbi:hypothetical protein OQA88_503 [Cercophora sp. LCS_1]
MSKATSPNTAHQVSDDYYSDEAPIFQNSPVLRPHVPQLQPLRTQPITSTNPTVSPESSPGTPKSNGRSMKVAPSLGDAVLVGSLDGNRHPELAVKAGLLPLPGPNDVEEELDFGLSDSPREGYRSACGGDLRGGGGDKSLQDTEPEEMVLDPPEQEMGAFNLKSLAASALGLRVTVATAEPSPPEPIDEVPIDAVPTPPPTEHAIPKEKHPSEYLLSTKHGAVAPDRVLRHPPAERGATSDSIALATVRDKRPNTTALHKGPTRGPATSRDGE